MTPFSRRLAFDGADKWRVDILQTASDWFCPSFRTDDGKRAKGQKQLWLPTELSTAKCTQQFASVVCILVYGVMANVEF